MIEAPSYAILGHGRWAAVIRDVLEGMGRRSTFIEDARRKSSETDSGYKARLTAQIADSHAEIAWICTPPGPHVLLMIEAAIAAGLHVIVEKPWPYSLGEVRPCLGLARAKGRQVGVHFEYCLLEAVESWRNEFNRGAGLRFGGHFRLSGPDRLGMPAIDNLGCHLLAIREYAVPEAELSEIVCDYESVNERRVWVQKENREVASIRFAGSKEPIIQRYIAKFEDALDGTAFPLNLEFAARVADSLARWKQSHS
jgi:predicted dehydrogenase